MATTTFPPAVQDAVHFLRDLDLRASLDARYYLPATIVQNWRVVGTTAVMVGLCLCPLLLGSAEETMPGKADDDDDDDDDGEDS